MSDRSSSSGISLDTWAVLLALAIAAVVRTGIVTAIPW